MNEKVRLEIYGEAQLHQMFDELPKEVEDKVYLSAFRKAARLINDNAKAKLYTRIKKPFDIILNFGTSKITSGGIGIIAGIKNRKKGSLAHLFENGTDERTFTTKQAGFHKVKRYGFRTKFEHKTGKIKANHFWSDANADTQDMIKELIYSDIESTFSRMIRKFDAKKKTQS